MRRSATALNDLPDAAPDPATPAPSAPPTRTLCLLPGRHRRPAEPAPSLPFHRWDRYRGVQLLGEGGMGRVFRAHDPLLDRTVALKFPRRREAGRGGRSLYEARLQSRAAGAHVPEVLEVGELEGQPYFAMRYVDGPTLKTAGREMDLATRIEVGLRLCHALDAIHEVGLVHRDVNPRNVLLQPGRPAGGDGWWPWVIDFGIAHELPYPSRPVDPRVVGTAPYMAPEQVLGRTAAIDRRTDVYSLGATLYELFSGVQPFSAASSEAILTKALHEDPAPLAEVAPELPAALGTVVGRCLDKAPERRYPTARAVAEELSTACAYS